MEMLIFLLNSLLFGIALAIDAFSVSVANGLSMPNMRKRMIVRIAGMFAFFQILMPMIGWLCVHTILTMFSSFSAAIPYIALALLLFLGLKMIWEGFHPEKETGESGVSFGVLILQGIATSIDALSVGFTIAEYAWQKALAESLIIGGVTFALCWIGVIIGKKLGNRFNGKVTIVGGIILIGIGLEIFLTGVL